MGNEILSAVQARLLQSEYAAASGAQSAAQGTSFSELLERELTANTSYMDLLEKSKAVSKEKGMGDLIDYTSPYGIYQNLGADGAAAMKHAEAEAVQAARTALIENEKAEQQAKEGGSGSMLESLFGSGTSLSEALMLFCLMLSSGGMGEDGALSGGMGLMLTSLAKAVSEKSKAEQETLRYEMNADGYKSGGMDDALSYVNESIFSGTSEANFPYRASKPTTPLVRSTEQDREPALYRQVIDQFQVTENPRYAVNKKGTGDTYCNIFLWDVTSAMGAEIPYYTDWDTGEPVQYPDVDGAKHMNANRIYDWLAEHGQTYGWHEVTAEQAQALANQGRPAVTIWKNPSGGHGHCQIVSPSMDGQYNTERGVAIAQAGRKLYDYGYITNVYSSSLPSVKYYAHA